MNKTTMKNYDVVTKIGNLYIARTEKHPGVYYFFRNNEMQFSTKASTMQEAQNKYEIRCGKNPIKPTNRSNYSDRYFFGNVSDHEMDMYQ